MEVDRRRVGDGQFPGRSADQRCDLRSQVFRESEPGRLGREPAIDREGFPFRQDALHGRLGIYRQAAERVAVEVDSPRRQVEPRAQMAQGIGPVERLGMADGRIEVHLFLVNGPSGCGATGPGRRVTAPGHGNRYHRPTTRI
jgi:hypothetical protein